jgi:hypothetical protein
MATSVSPKTYDIFLKIKVNNEKCKLLGNIYDLC